VTANEGQSAADLDRRLADAIERLGHGLRSLAQHSARGQGLSPLQQQVVLMLAQQPTARREVNALAAEFDVTTPTMSDAVGALERKQMLTRSPGPDGRRRLLTLTGRGEAVARELSTWDEPLGLAHRLPGARARDRLTANSALVAHAPRRVRGAVLIGRSDRAARLLRLIFFLLNSADLSSPRCRLRQG
jgi:DNA-binding MarR family transcriptional regulator